MIRPCPPMLVRLALVGVAGALLVDVVALTLDLIRLRRLRAGVEFDEVGLDIASTLSGAANLLVPVAVLGAAVVFAWWFAAAYRRLAQVEPTFLEPHWAVVGWLVPGLNLVRPPGIMRELVSKPGSSSSNDPGPVLVIGWWVLWIEGAVIQVVLRFITPTTNWGWTRWQSAALLSDLILLASIACVLVLIGMIERRQRGLPVVTGSGGYARPLAAATRPPS